MGTRRLGFALAIALLLSLAVTSIFYIRVRRQQTNVTVKKVVGAATKLAPGTPLTAQNLTLIDWPTSVPLEGAIQKPEELVGRVLMYPVGEKEPVRSQDLAAANSGIGLSAKIPDGMRATAVKTNEVNNVAGFLFPGCRVDVLATLRLDRSTLTRTVLQNVQVLSAGTRTEPDPQGKPENVSVVTVLTTPEQSQQLVLAATQGSIQFVLRNGGDNAQSSPAPVELTELFGTPKPTVAPQAQAKKHGAAPKPNDVYQVQTVAGEKVTVAKFDVAKE